MENEVKQIYCSFCGAANISDSVSFMIKSDGANICDCCVDICIGIINEARVPMIDYARRFNRQSLLIETPTR